MDEKSKAQVDVQAMQAAVQNMMESPGFRLECLKLATTPTRHPEDVIKAAQRYMNFITNTSDPVAKKGVHDGTR